MSQPADSGKQPVGKLTKVEEAELMNLTMRLGYEPMLIATAAHLATRERAAQIASDAEIESNGAAGIAGDRVLAGDYTEALRKVGK